MKIRIRKLICKLCGKEWVPRKDDVRVCPKCKSPYFDTERKPAKDTVLSDL